MKESAVEKALAVEALASVREETQRVLDANPHSQELIHAHRLVKDACEAADKKNWLRCWRYIDHATPVYLEQDYADVGCKLMSIGKRLFHICHPPEYS